jgi:hypothetical protein
MNTLSKEERELIFDDLIKYYRFCKRDRRNHIFNAIYALEKNRKNGASKEELDKIKSLFQDAKNSYSYYSRMLMVALLLKLNRIDFITPNEKERAFVDLISHYDWRVKTCSYHIQCLERRLNECCEYENSQKIQEVEELFAHDLKERDKYVKKVNLANCIRNEIIKKMYVYFPLERKN